MRAQQPIGRMEDSQPLARLARFLWARRALSALALAALLGLAISAYLTTVHYANVPLVCSTTGPVNCAVVTSSAYSVVPFTQVPITVPGMLWFIASGGLALFALRRAWLGEPEPVRLRLAHCALAALGLVFVLYLVYVEIVLLRNICEWCTAVHLLTLLTFILTLLRLQERPGPLAASSVPAATPAHQMPASRQGSQATTRRPAKARRRRR